MRKGRGHRKVPRPLCFTRLPFHVKCDEKLQVKRETIPIERAGLRSRSPALVFVPVSWLGTPPG
jgi:hypothetical protein